MEHLNRDSRTNPENHAFPHPFTTRACSLSLSLSLSLSFLASHKLSRSSVTIINLCAGLEDLISQCTHRTHRTHRTPLISVRSQRLGWGQEKGGALGGMLTNNLALIKFH